MDENAHDENAHAGQVYVGTGALARPPGEARQGFGLYLDGTLAITMTAKVTGLIPMAHAADLKRAVDFYKLFGMEVRGSLRLPSGQLQWVHLACGQADLMFARASDPVIPGQQAVLFYLYSPDLIALSEHLLASGAKVSPDHLSRLHAQRRDSRGRSRRLRTPDRPGRLEVSRNHCTGSEWTWQSNEPLLRPAFEGAIGLALMLGTAVRLLMRRGSSDPSSLRITPVGDDPH